MLQDGSATYTALDPKNERKNEAQRGGAHPELSKKKGVQLFKGPL